MPERIIAAAIRFYDQAWSVPQPYRHCDVIRMYCAVTRQPRIPPKVEAGSVQGFVTDTGRFVDRREAAKLAFAAGQIDGPKDYLFSEDVW